MDSLFPCDTLFFSFPFSSSSSNDWKTNTKKILQEIFKTDPQMIVWTAARFLTACLNLLINLQKVFAAIKIHWHFGQNTAAKPLFRNVLLLKCMFRFPCKPHERLTTNSPKLWQTMNLQTWTYSEWLFFFQSSQMDSQWHQQKKKKKKCIQISFWIMKRSDLPFWWRN